jgi:hypothetical protein
VFAGVAAEIEFDKGCLSGRAAELKMGLKKNLQNVLFVFFARTLFRLNAS